MVSNECERLSYGPASPGNVIQGAPTHHPPSPSPRTYVNLPLWPAAAAGSLGGDHDRPRDGPVTSRLNIDYQKN